MVFFWFSEIFYGILSVFNEFLRFPWYCFLVFLNFYGFLDCFLSFLDIFLSFLDFFSGFLDFFPSFLDFFIGFLDFFIGFLDFFSRVFEAKSNKNLRFFLKPWKSSSGLGFRV